jgi:glycosyltransferase involved in cell wall biosynthesis
MSGQRKLAILLPNAWGGGMVRNAWSLARLIAGEDWPNLGRIEVVLGFREEGNYDWVAFEHESASIGPGVTVRRLSWQRWPASLAHKVMAQQQKPCSTAAVDQFSCPRDGGYDFTDCDAWIVFASSVEGHVIPRRPFAVYCADLIQRYVPAIFSHDPNTWSWQDETFIGWRWARCVFSTTPQTRLDVITYAGVHPDRALLVPTMVDAMATVAAPRDQTAEPYILWVTNAAPHKNHVAAVKALRAYYGELGGTLPLRICGATSDWLDPAGGRDLPGTKAFAAAPEVVARASFLGEVTDAHYLRLVADAAVVWHNVIVDNGTFVAFDAARAGCTLVSSDYPQMRYHCDRYGVAALFHPSADTSAAARALLQAERNWRAGIPPGHAPREDDPVQRRSAYGEMLNMLFNDVRT